MDYELTIFYSQVKFTVLGKSFTQMSFWLRGPIVIPKQHKLNLHNYILVSLALEGIL